MRHKKVGLGLALLVLLLSAVPAQKDVSGSPSRRRECFRACRVS
jgi:hypothetical protein